MSKNKKFIKKTVYIHPENNTLCSCDGDFYKTCPLKLASNLDCSQSIISITPIKKENNSSLASESIRDLDDRFSDLIDPLRDFHKS